MISIIIATKNGGKWLYRSIASIEAQSEKDIEVLVISDGSTDNTPAIVRGLASSRPWLRLIELKENVGPGLARDRGIKEAQGEYIALLDDDDKWIGKNKLQIQSEYLKNNPEYMVVGASRILEVDITNKPLSSFTLPADDSSIRSSIMKRNCFVTSSVMLRKDAYLKAGGFPALYLAEDYDLWLRMGLEGKFANLDGCDVQYTIHSQGASKMRQLELYKTILSILKQHKGEYPHYAIGYTKAKLRIIYSILFSKYLNIATIPFLKKFFRRVA